MIALYSNYEIVGVLIDMFIYIPGICVELVTLYSMHTLFLGETESAHAYHSFEQKIERR